MISAASVISTPCIATSAPRLAVADGTPLATSPSFAVAVRVGAKGRAASWSPEAHLAMSIGTMVTSVTAALTVSLETSAPSVAFGDISVLSDLRHSYRQADKTKDVDQSGD